jgi:hypothetical protein
VAGAVYRFGEGDSQSVFREDPDAVEDPTLAFFLAYWRSSRCANGIPLSNDFRPREVGTHLRWVALVDVLPEKRDYRYRVVGSSVCEFFLGDGTGKTVRELFADLPEMQKTVLQLYAAPVRLRRPTQFSGPPSHLRDRFCPAYDGLFLPYSSDGEKIDRIVTAFVFNYTKFRQKRAILPGEALV